MKVMPNVYRNIEPVNGIEVGSAWELIGNEYVLVENEEITADKDDEDDKFVLDDLYFECID